jgi:serine/threonine protein kinase
VLRTQYYTPDVRRIKQSDVLPSRDFEVTLTEQEARLRVFRVRYEIKFWSRIHHENTLPLLDWWEDDDGMYATSPYCHDGTLYEFIQKKPLKRLDITLARVVIRGVAKALDYLHSEAGVVHGDVKLEHVYVQRLGATWYKVMLGGFGLSQLMDPGENAELFQLIRQQYDEGGDVVLSGGSIPYCAPERLVGGEKLTKEMDTWSLGVLAYAVVCGRMPFQDEYEPRLVSKILRGEWEWPPTLDVEDGIKECIQGWLRLQPGRRWSVKAGLRGEWLRGG